MDFSFSEEQQSIRELAAQILSDRTAPERLAEIDAKPDSYDAELYGDLAKAKSHEDPIFGFEIPTRCPEVPDKVLLPRNTWDDGEAYDAAARELAARFQENFMPPIPTIA